MIDPIADFGTQEVLARTLWGEARGQGIDGMHAVASVIQNRANHPCWWGHDLRSVCLAPEQFSCWNGNDPQHKLMRATTIMDRAYPTAESLAALAVAGQLQDITDGADHYCTKAVVDKTAWARNRTPVFTYGTHLFYRIGPNG